MLSTPIKIGGSWRIKRYDGALVGWYASKVLAQQAVDNAPYLQPPATDIDDTTICPVSGTYCSYVDCDDYGCCAIS